MDDDGATSSTAAVGREGRARAAESSQPVPAGGDATDAAGGLPGSRIPSVGRAQVDKLLGGSNAARSPWLVPVSYTHLQSGPRCLVSAGGDLTREWKLRSQTPPLHRDPRWGLARAVRWTKGHAYLRWDIRSQLGELQQPAGRDRPVAAEHFRHDAFGDAELFAKTAARLKPRAGSQVKMQIRPCVSRHLGGPHRLPKLHAERTKLRIPAGRQHPIVYLEKAQGRAVYLHRPGHCGLRLAKPQPLLSEPATRRKLGSVIHVLHSLPPFQEEDKSLLRSEALHLRCF